MLRSGRKKLAARLKRHPRDQYVRVALAESSFAAGKVKRARKLLSVTPAGLLIPSAQTLLARIHNSLGDQAQAIMILEESVEPGLARLKAARATYDKAFQAFKDRVFNGPPDRMLERRLKNKTDADARDIVRKWFEAKVVKDQKLNRLRDEYEASTEVVFGAVLLGTMQLTRANGLRGEAKSQALAEAERTMLSTQAEAQGMPLYHLGLGQIYHRLGKPKAGDSEFDSVLRGRDPWMHMGVAAAYRSLGLRDRAREVATRVFSKESDKAVRTDAAIVLSLLGESDEDREAWLVKAPMQTDEVRRSRDNLRAGRLFREGKYKQADRIYARIAAANEKMGAHNAVAVNNGALAHGKRYACTGDRRHLARAHANLERALRLKADDALVAANLSQISLQLGVLELLDGYIDVDAIRPSYDGAMQLCYALARGSAQATISEAVLENAHLRRGQEIGRHHHALAPESAESLSPALFVTWVLDDAARARELLPALEHIPSSERVKATDEDNKKRVEAYGQSIARYEAVLRAKPAKKHKKRTAGAVHLILARLYEGRANSALSKADMETAIQHAEKARRDFPEVGSDLLGSLLLELAVWKAVGDEAGGWLRDGLLTDYVLMDPAKVSAAGVDRGLLERARKARADRKRLGQTDLAVARLLKDEALAKRAAEDMRSDVNVLTTKLEMLTDRGNPLLVARLQMLEKK